MTTVTEPPKPIVIAQREYEKCVCCGHIIGWHFRASEKCEHVPGIGEAGDCGCTTAVCQAEADAIREFIATNRDVKYMKYMTGLKTKVIEEFAARKLRMYHNGERWIPRL